MARCARWRDEGWWQTPPDGASRLLHGELIHRGEQPGVLAFEAVPARQIDHRRIVRVGVAVRLEHAGVQIEAEKLQAVRGEEIGDLRQRVLVLLNVKEKIAAGWLRFFVK